MGKRMRKLQVVILALSMLWMISFIIPIRIQAASSKKIQTVYAKNNASKIRLYTRESKKVTISTKPSKAFRKISKIKANKRGIVSWKKKKNKITFKGNKAGKATITIYVQGKKGKTKKKKLYATVLAKSVVTPTPSPSPSPSPSPAPSPEPKPIVPTNNDYDNNIIYMPDVNSELCTAKFWYNKDKESGEVLKTLEEIQTINQETMAKGVAKVGMYDLTNQAEVFDGAYQNENLYNELATLFKINESSVKTYYHDTGAKWTKDELTALAENVKDQNPSVNQQIQYGLCSTRSDLRAFPTDEIMSDSSTDPDYDLAENSSVRLNEPVVIRSTSADGRFYLVRTTSCTGWVRVSDLAVCDSKEEWQQAWDTKNSETLVVTADKFYLEKSNYAPDLSEKMLSMGTTLPLVPKAELPANNMVNNRSIYNNYVVYMPGRDADGKYVKKMALIGENKDVSIGFLPLTRCNILNEAFKMLGNCYGWGGMLGSQDCSGYIRDVYRCFGYDLPRNTTWQKEIAAKQYDISNMSDDEKKVAIDQMLPGTILFFNGHEMMYLGKEGSQYYVISSVSSIRIVKGESNVRIRSVFVNSLDVLRGTDTTWLHNLTTGVAPFLQG